MAYSPRRSLSTVRDGLDRLIAQFRAKPVLTAELTSFLARVQEIEDALWSIVLGRSIASLTSPGGVTLAPGVGIQLDVLGKIVGAPRAGLSDADYLIALAAQIFVNRSSGRFENYLHLLHISSPPGVTGYTTPGGVVVPPWTVTEGYPAAVMIQIYAHVTWALLVTWRYLRLVKAAGVRLLLTSSVATQANTFQPYDVSSGAPPSPVTYGYDSTTGSATPGVYASTLGA